MSATQPLLVCYRFGRFSLDPSRRDLSAAGVSVSLSSRAYDVLQLLIEQRGRVVTKDEIMSTVWRNAIVEDNNLAVQISALRRALEQRPGASPVILTVPGRGYRFVAEVEECAPPPTKSATPPPVARAAPDRPPIPDHAPVPPPAAASTPARARPWGSMRSATLVLLAGLLGLAATRAWWPTHVPPRLSIVVLPFRNLSGDPRQDYLADAVSDDLTTDLSHLPGSLVIARETADAYKGHAVPADTIGRTLNVRYLMEGSLSAGPGNSVHINAQLIDTSTGGHLWADMFDVQRDRIGEAQFDIVRHIASALNYTLVQVESARSLRERPGDPDAIDLYLQARSVMDRDPSMAGLASTKSLLQQAVRRDPDYAEALAALGSVLLVIITIDDPNESADFETAKTLIEHAVALSPRNPRVLAANGYLLAGEENCAAAIPQFEVAVQIDPNDTEARGGLGECAFRLGRPAAMLEQLQAIQRIDPQAGHLGRRLEKEAMCTLFMGQPAQALKLVNQALSTAQDGAAQPPDLGWQEWGTLWAIAARAELGDLDGARALYRTYDRQWHNRTVWRIGGYSTRAMADLPASRAIEAALLSAGMPRFASETAAPPDPASDARLEDFRATPLAVPGVQRVETADVIRSVHDRAPPTVLDVGHGLASIPSAIWVGENGWWRSTHDLIVDRRTKDGHVDYDTPVIVMGDGPYGTPSYDMARQLAAWGFRSVRWYRGGEESWFAAQQAFKDRRLQ